LRILSHLGRANLLLGVAWRGGLPGHGATCSRRSLASTTVPWPCRLKNAIRAQRFWWRARVQFYKNPPRSNVRFPPPSANCGEAPPLHRSKSYDVHSVVTAAAHAPRFVLFLFAEPWPFACCVYTPTGLDGCHPAGASFGVTTGRDNAPQVEAGSSRSREAYRFFVHVSRFSCPHSVIDFRLKGRSR